MPIHRERTKAGLVAAKARGRSGGRPAKLVGERAEHAPNLLGSGSSVLAVARSMGVSRAAVHRAMERIAETPQEAERRSFCSKSRRPVTIDHRLETLTSAADRVRGDSTDTVFICFRL
jgi:DNA invertase Pin-like site-specific DNA recombinase